jgi:hypothetical protein
MRDYPHAVRAGGNIVSIKSEIDFRNVNGTPIANFQG